jgi:hypothetical protein
LVYLGAATIIAAWVALGARLDNLAAAFCFLAAAFHFYFRPPKHVVPKSDLSSLITLAPLLILSGAVVVVAFYEPALKYAVMAFVGLSAIVFARDIFLDLRRTAVES